MFEMRDLTSSFIKRVGHAGSTLRVELKSGKTYDYPCTVEDFQNLLASDSVGAYFGAVIRPAGGKLVEPEAAQS